MLWRACVLLLGAGAVLANVCYMGNEPDLSGKMRWVLPYTDPCNCTEIRPGGVNMRTPRRPFDPLYFNSPVITKNQTEIMQLLNCTSPPLLKKLVCEYREFSIACGSNETINVKWALYGREEGVPYCRIHDNPRCGNETASTQKVQDECNRKQECTFEVTNDYFGGDPCVDVGKYVIVQYVCLPLAQ